MKKRYFVLFFLIIFRLVLGYVEASKYTPGREISVTGNTNRIYHNDNKCIIYLGRFILQTEEICAIYPNSKIQAIGTVGKEVLLRIFGRISLVDGKIYRLDKYQDLRFTSDVFGGVVGNFREILLNRIRKVVPEPEAGLVAGIVLGYKKDIGQNFYQKMVNSGTVHVAVASGYNVMLVGGMILSLCFWILRRKWATMVAIAVMIFYGVLAGAEPPVIRAVLMAGLIYIAQAMGKTSASWWILCLAAWSMLMWDPYLVMDVSFQLSVAASVGIIGVEPWVKKQVIRIAGESVEEFLAGIGVTISVSTMATTAVIIWWHFGRMTWIGIVSNALILPLVPILMTLSGLMLLFGNLLSMPVYTIAHFMVGVIGFLGS